MVVATEVNLCTAADAGCLRLPSGIPRGCLVCPIWLHSADESRRTWSGQIFASNFEVIFPINQSGLMGQDVCSHQG
jgi:hypothetical protein